MMESLLPAHGYEVAFCDGPEHLAGGCPLVERQACPLVEWADVILNSLNLDRSDNRAVLTALRSTHPRTPLIARRAPMTCSGCSETPSHPELG